MNVVRFVPVTKGRPQWSLAAPSEEGAWRNLESYYSTRDRDGLKRGPWAWEVKAMKLPDDSRVVAPRRAPAHPTQR